MQIRFTDSIEDIDWNQLAVVFKRAPLGNREPDSLKQLFMGSNVRCFVFDSNIIIGAGRAISDSLKFAMIFDVVLLPEYQGFGIGRQLLELLASRSKALNILLFAEPGKEGFYEKLGYKKMKTAMALFAEPDRKRAQGYI